MFRTLFSSSVSILFHHLEILCIDQCYLECLTCQATTSLQQEIIEAIDEAARKYMEETLKAERSDFGITLVMSAAAKIRLNSSRANSQNTLPLQIQNLELSFLKMYVKSTFVIILFYQMAHSLIIYTDARILLLLEIMSQITKHWSNNDKAEMTTKKCNTLQRLWYHPPSMLGG